MRLTYYCYFLQNINSAIDSGKYQDISVEEVEDRIERGDLVPYLRERLGEDVDLSLPDPSMAAELNAKLQDLLGGYRGRERRKWGVEHSGLCLLVAWTSEIIQQRWWE